jgi:hypothetical protein
MQKTIDESAKSNSINGIVIPLSFEELMANELLADDDLPVKSENLK